MSHLIITKIARIAAPSRFHPEDGARAGGREGALPSKQAGRPGRFARLPVAGGTSLAATHPMSIAPTTSADRGGPAQPLLLVHDLKKHFPIKGGIFGATVATVRAVDGVSFAVRKGETLGIVGESGCGKSTTARLLMQLTAPDAGHLVFDGEGVGEHAQTGGMSLKDYRRQVQMVFQ